MLDKLFVFDKIVFGEEFGLFVLVIIFDLLEFVCKVEDFEDFEFVFF